MNKREQTTLKLLKSMGIETTNQNKKFKSMRQIITEIKKSLIENNKKLDNY